MALLFSAALGTICAVLVEDIMRNISVKLFSVWTNGSGENVVYRSYLEFWRPFCSTELNHLCTFGNIMRNISVKLFYIRSNGSGDVI